jgi:hypothetical protein
MLAGSGRADEPSIKNDPVLKYFIGKWTAEGELKSKDGNVTKVKEEWKGQAVSDNTLTLEGKYDINGGSQGFEWNIIHNAGVGTYEATFRPDTASNNSEHFEISIQEAELKVESTALLGDGTSKLNIVETITGKDHDQIESKITLTNSQGEVQLSGMIKHQREKE